MGLRHALTASKLPACATLFVVPTLALAQAPDVTSLRSDQAAAAMHKFALCAATRNNVADKVMATLPQTRAEEAAVRRLIDPAPDCEIGGTSLVFAQRYMRGGVAEHLLKRDFHGLQGPARRRTAAVFPIPEGDDVGTLSDGTKGSIGMIIFGQCVSQSDSAGVAAVLETRSGGPIERAAFAKLDKAMRGCAPNPVILNIARLQMRGYLAEGAYRNAVASQAGPN